MPRPRAAASTATSPLNSPRLLRAYAVRRRGPTVVQAWLATRVAMVLILILVERIIVGDVFYYRRKISTVLRAGLDHTLNEYPTPVVWILSLPYGLGFGTRAGYLVAFLLLMLALDAVFTLALYRTGGRRHDLAVDFWLAFVFLIGPLSYVRFDILPAVLAGGALLAARRRPWVVGALTGLGAAIKLWPALLIPAFLSHKPDRKAAIWGFVGAGFGLAAVSLAVGGWSRLVSPLTWQSGRGLQIESIWATPLMLARAFGPHRWWVDISRFQAYEIFGVGRPPLLLLSDLSTLVGLLVVVALWLRLFLSGRPTAVAVGFVLLTTIAVTIVTNKTLSPQYLLWLGGPTAALLLLRRDARPDERARVLQTARLLLLLALLTQLVYPLLYDGLLGRLGPVLTVVSTTVTAARNLLLVWFTIVVTRAAWRLAKRAPQAFEGAVVR